MEMFHSKWVVGNLSLAEYEYLQYVGRKHLNTVLKLNLLPDMTYLSHAAQKKAGRAIKKIDDAELVLEEFAIIERESINLNLARLASITGKDMRRTWR